MGRLRSNDKATALVQPAAGTNNFATLPGHLPTAPNERFTVKLEPYEGKGGKIDGYRQKGSGWQVLVRCANIVSIADKFVKIGVCELVAAGGQIRTGPDQKPRCPREVKIHRGQLAQDLLRTHQSLRCKIIAYQRPKPGKCYVNLPETIVIGTLDGEGNNGLEHAFSRSTLLSVYRRESIDSLLGPIMLMARPGWQKYPFGECASSCTSTHLSPTLKPLDTSAMCRALLDSGYEQNRFQGDPHMFDTSTAPGIAQEGPYSPPIAGSMVSERSLCLTSLPTEILVMIMPYVLDGQLPSKAINGSKSHGLDTLPGIITTNRLLSGVALDWLYHQKLTVRCWSRQIMECCVTLLENAFNVCFDLSYIEGECLPLNLSYVLDIWKRKNQLKHVTIFLPATPPREPWTYFPDILQPQLKTDWILSLLQPLTLFFETHKIDYHADINTADQVEAQDHQVEFGGRNALNWAAGLENEMLVEQILSLPDPGFDEPDVIGHTPLFTAVWTGNPRTVELLIDTGKVDVNRRCRLGVTPLGAAIMEHNSEIAALLLKEGNAMPDRFMLDRHPTALWYAARENNREIVDLLLRDQSVDANVKDKNGRTPLYVAIEEHGDSSLDVVKALLKRASLSINDRKGQTPLTLAQGRGYIRIVEELQKWNADG